jgi:hypothetical protein
VLSPAEMGGAESLLAPPLRALADRVTGGGGRPIVFGARPSDALRAAAAAAGVRPSEVLSSQRGAAEGQYLVALDARGRVLVALAHLAPPRALLRAYVHALYLSRHAGRRRPAAEAAAAAAAAAAGPAAAAAALVAEAERWAWGPGGVDALLAAAEAAGWQAAGASLPRPACTGKWG